MKMVQTLNLRQKNIKSSHCDSDAYILVIGDIIATNGDENTDIAFKNCAAFTKSITHKWWNIDTAESIDITMPIHNLIEYSDSYSDKSGSLWQFKRD